MGVAEQSINELDVRVTAIESIPGVGAFTNTSRGTILGSAEDGKVSANEDGTGSVSGWSDVVKSAQISDMLTKTDAAAAYLTKTDAAATYESIEDAEQINVVANEAKSTAEDAQTKANGCFNSVAVNTAGDGLIFTTSGDDQVEVAIPSSLKIIDLANSVSVPSLKGTTSNWRVVSTGFVNCPLFFGTTKSTPGIVRYLKGKIVLLTPTYSVPITSSSVYCVYTWTDEGMAAFNTYVTQIINVLGLDDGTYQLRWGGSVHLTYANGLPVSSVSISDGEITSITYPSVTAYSASSTTQYSTYVSLYLVDIS